MIYAKFLHKKISLQVLRSVVIDEVQHSGFYINLFFSYKKSASRTLL